MEKKYLILAMALISLVLISSIIAEDTYESDGHHFCTKSQGYIELSGLSGAPYYSASDNCFTSNTLIQYECQLENGAVGVKINSINCGCGASCENAACTVCVPQCSGKQCGDDGCCGSCGTCSSTQTCQSNQCVNNPITNSGNSNSGTNTNTNTNTGTTTSDFNLNWLTASIWTINGFALQVWMLIVGFVLIIFLMRGKK